jgi:hypothetical protein
VLVEHAKLSHGVVRRVRRRQDLAHPVGEDPDGAIARALGHALPAPSRQVVAVGLVGLVEDLDLAHQPPSSRAPGSTPASTSEAEEDAAKTHLRAAMVGTGRRLVDQLSPDDLRCPLPGQDQEILRGREPLRGIRHAPRLA